MEQNDISQSNLNKNFGLLKSTGKVFAVIEKEDELIQWVEEAMPEDAGKKRYIRDFLQQVKSGTGFVDDIRIERVIRLPGSEGEGSTAKSLSGGKYLT